MISRAVWRSMVRMDERPSALDPQPWTWPGSRVLIEQADAAGAEALGAAFRHAGFAVSICAGPLEGEHCPLTGDAGCAAAAGADAVVSALGFETPEAREALAALRLRVPGIPLLVAADPGAGRRWPELLGGCETVASTATPQDVVARVQALLEPGDDDAA